MVKNNEFNNKSIEITNEYNNKSIAITNDYNRKSIELSKLGYVMAVKPMMSAEIHHEQGEKISSVSVIVKNKGVGPMVMKEVKYIFYGVTCSNELILRSTINNRLNSELKMSAINSLLKYKN